MVLHRHALELKSLQILLKRIMDSLIICGAFEIFLHFFIGTLIKTLCQGIEFNVPERIKSKELDSLR